MASDWILLERHPDDGKIQAIAAMCGMPADAVFSGVVRWFFYVDRHIPNGRIRIPKTAVMGITCLQSFALVEAMCAPSVGWLHDHGDDVSVKDFNEWFSKSSKKRHLATKRKQRQREKEEREKSRKRPPDVTQPCDKSGTIRNDTLRINIKETPLTPPSGGSANAALSLAEEILVEEFGMNRTTKADARRLDRSAADLAPHLDGMDRKQVEVLWPKVRRRYREMFPNGAWTARAVLKHWTRLIKEVKS